MDDMPMKKMIEAALENIRKVADADTVIGQPISLPDGVTIIPFSKVSVGFASGGSDLAANADAKTPRFAGGNGAGLTVVPLGFIIATGTDVRIVDLSTPNSFNPQPASDDPIVKTIDTISTLIDVAPAFIAKIKDKISEQKAKTEEDNTEINAEIIVDADLD